LVLLDRMEQGKISYGRILALEHKIMSHRRGGDTEQADRYKHVSSVLGAMNHAIYGKACNPNGYKV